MYPLDGAVGANIGAFLPEFFQLLRIVLVTKFEGAIDRLVKVVDILESIISPAIPFMNPIRPKNILTLWCSFILDPIFAFNPVGRSVLHLDLCIHRCLALYREIRRRCP